MPLLMEFELTFRLLFGDRAKYIEGQQANTKSRTAWLRKALDRIEREIDKLETTARHKQMLLGEVEAARETAQLKSESGWPLVYCLLRLVVRLLGYDFVRGAKCHTATYWQSAPQNLNSVVFQGGDIMQDYYDRKMQSPFAEMWSCISRNSDCPTIELRLFSTQRSTKSRN